MEKSSAKIIIKNALLNILDNKENYKVFLFGSRVKGDYKNNSDYDIGIIKGNKRINFIELIRLKRKLDELPYLIDLIDFNDVSNDFKSLALKNTEKWN